MDPLWAERIGRGLVKGDNGEKTFAKNDKITVMTRKEWKTTPEAKWEMGSSELEGIDELDAIAAAMLGSLWRELKTVQYASLHLCYKCTLCVL